MVFGHVDGIAIAIAVPPTPPTDVSSLHPHSFLSYAVVICLLSDCAGTGAETGPGTTRVVGSSRTIGQSVDYYE